MVSYVTQNFQVLDSSNSKKPPIYRRNEKSVSRMDIVPNDLVNRINHFEQPMIKYSAKPSMLLPRSAKSAEQSPIDFFQSYNDSVYELLIKSKRRAIIAKYNAAQAVNSLRNDSFCNNSALSDRICSPYEDERLSSFLNNMTNKRRKSALSANRTKYFHSPTYEHISGQKPIYSTSKPSSPTSQMTDSIFENESKSTNTRPHTSIDIIDNSLQYHTEIERPKTSQSMNREGDLDFIAKFLRPKPLVQSIDSREDMSVDGIKLYTEKFIRMSKPKEFLTSSPLILNKDDKGLVNSENNLNNKNNSKKKWTTNEDTLNELDDEELKEIQTNIEKKNENTNLSTKPPSSPVSVINKPIIENNNAAKFINTVEAAMNNLMKPNQKSM